MASRIAVPDTAFSLDTRATRNKRPRLHSKSHLEFIRALPCVCCGARGSTEAAHVRAPAAMFGKPVTGMGRKPDDIWTVPLCGLHHRAQHATSEMSFWEWHGLNPHTLALALWVASGDADVAEVIISEHLKRVKRPLP